MEIMVVILESRRKDHQWGEGDMVCVLLESVVVSFEKKTCFYDLCVYKGEQVRGFPVAGNNAPTAKCRPFSGGLSPKRYPGMEAHAWVTCCM